MIADHSLRRSTSPARRLLFCFLIRMTAAASGPTVRSHLPRWISLPSPKGIRFKARGCSIRCYPGSITPTTPPTPTGFCIYEPPRHSRFRIRQAPEASGSPIPIVLMCLPPHESANVEAIIGRLPAKRNSDVESKCPANPSKVLHRFQFRNSVFLSLNS